MKATKVEIFIPPQYVAAAYQYLNTEGTRLLTASPHGVVAISTNKETLAAAISKLADYVSQYTTEPMHVTTYNINHESYNATH